MMGEHSLIWKYQKTKFHVSGNICGGRRVVSGILVEGD